MNWKTLLVFFFFYTIHIYCCTKTLLIFLYINKIVK
uniref:Uncharacterized protein n=1 Tax=Rhizophora mucronata TaxID=61149 RepID=A0A2P2NXT5_RHIMU